MSGVRSYIALQEIQKDVIICVTTRLVCASMTPTRVDFAWKMDRIALSPMAITICAHLCTTSRRFRRWRIRTRIRTPRPMGLTYSTKSGTWWMKIPNGRIRITFWAITRPNHARDRRDYVGRVTPVRNITTARIRGAVRGNINIGKFINAFLQSSYLTELYHLFCYKNI